MTRTASSPALPSSADSGSLASRHRALVATLVLAVAALFGAPAITSSAAPAAAEPDADGWTVVAPEDEGMDTAGLDATRGYAFQADRHTQGVVVARHGRIVSEWYADGEGPLSWGASWSMAKSFTSAVVGIAIDEGYIDSVDVSMAEFFPDWAGTDKAAITLRDVLHMESGLKWNENYDPGSAGESDIIQMGLSVDQLAYAASRPVEVPPGTRFNYSSGDTMLLSWVIETTTGMPADEYARQKLFEPLGMDQVEWWRDGAGHTLTYCCLDTTSRNYARMGLLYLGDGEWNGQQIVPASWVEDSTTGTGNSGGTYGYQWWIQDHDFIEGPVIMMAGFDGQMVYVIPSLDLVVVRNGDYVKSECAPIADPNLFGIYPPSDLVPGRGTRPPESWSHADFLSTVVDAVTGDGSGDDVVPAAQPATSGRNPQGEPMVPCEADQPPTTEPVTTVPASVPSSPAAAPIAASADYAG